jgi:hypothetical protein
MARWLLASPQVRALSRVATPHNEAALLEMALYVTGAQLERICRGFRSAQVADEGPSREARSVRRRLLPGGMVKLEVVLCPDEADLVMLDPARDSPGAAVARPRLCFSAAPTKYPFRTHVRRGAGLPVFGFLETSGTETK